MTQYAVRFNIMSAQEGGYPTGHANVTLIQKDDSGYILSATTYGTSTNSLGTIQDATNPGSTIMDGYTGIESGDMDPLSATFSRQLVSKELSLSAAQFQALPSTHYR
jgi:hypothetical protein